MGEGREKREQVKSRLMVCLQKKNTTQHTEIRLPVKLGREKLSSLCLQSEWLKSSW